MRRISAVSFVAILAGCVTTPPEEDPVQIRLNELDARLQRIERVISNQSLLELAQRNDALQSELRTLRGRLEELEFGAEALRKQQRDLYADLDQRLSQLSTAPAPGAGGVAAAMDEQAAYAQAFDALKVGNYPGAVSGFQDFIARYPQSSLAENAQYWLGEAYYVTRDYQNAAAAFRSVLERYPGSRKAPDALVKLGFTQYELKQYDDARATLNEVVQRYPDTDAARLAAERLQRLPGAAG